MTASDFATRVNSIDWFHSIDLGNGIVSPGRKSLDDIAEEQHRFFDPIKLEGATVLDVGAWNGAHAFGAKRRGASRVLAVDHYAWNSEYFRGREAFDMANDALGLNIEVMDIDVPAISPGTVGTFDVVLFLGVLYHLPSPLEGLEAVADVTKDCLVIETHSDLMDHPLPALAYYPSVTLEGDGSNYFGPNLPFIVEVLKECGFTVFDSRHGENHRLTVHAWRNTGRRRIGGGPEIHFKRRDHGEAPTSNLWWRRFRRVISSARRLMT
jgi:tRNA (mo5U34)-methyltransferase